MRNWIIVFFVIFAARLSAHDGDSIKITHGPYLCDMSTDGVTVVWTTNKPALSWVEVAPAGEDHFYGKERPRYYDTESGRKRANDTIHRVRIKHLEPGREYRYRIFSREVVSWPSSDWVTYGLIAASNVYKQEPFRFRTFDDRKKEISFLVLNDIHGRSDYMKSLCREVDFKSLDFVLLNGDMSSWVEGQEQICKDYIDACVELFASEVPIVFNRGNHETRGVYLFLIPVKISRIRIWSMPVLPTMTIIEKKKPYGCGVWWKKTILSNHPFGSHSCTSRRR